MLLIGTPVEESMVSVEPALYPPVVDSLKEEYLAIDSPVVSATCLVTTKEVTLEAKM